MAIALTLQQYMQDQDIPFDIISHEKTRTSGETASVAHVSGNCLAKTVILEDELGYVMVVVPASHQVSLSAVDDQMRRRLTLVSETELPRLFSDCALGAIPPIGDAYGIETMVDDSLAEQTDIYFEGGDHELLVHVSNEQFDMMMIDAMHGNFSHHS